MLRRSSLALLAVCGLAGCQAYNFNPVGKCVIQPGSSRIQLSGQATADILFVVDDSGSMQPEQQRLAANFKSFLDALAQAQKDRAAAGLDPFEFHIAITTSSIFEGWVPYDATTCAGQPSLVCDVKTSHYTRAENPVACSDAGLACDDLVQNYFPASYFAPTNPTGCTAGLASPDAPYPKGNFMAAAGNPAVLHFTKDIWAGTADANAKLALLTQQFQQNINVGTCGSGMEQHFEAGRLAVEKALAGKQPGATADEWPHAGAKLVVVWLGDEDDCSNPNDATRSLAFDTASANPGSDVCIADQQAAASGKPGKLYTLDRYASYFTSLNRAFGAAFIYSSDPASCKDDGTGNRICSPGTCTCQCPTTCASCGATATGECYLPPNCQGWIPALPVPGGSRFAELSTLFRNQGVNTFEGSVCEGNWGTTLQGIAQLVKPPPGLTLPTQPAASQVALLRIESADGKTSRYCTGPAQSQAELTTADWWFVDCKTGAPVLSGTTSCININHATKHCEPNPGESYIAQYLGVVPSPTADNPTGGCQTAADCQKRLGGDATSWQCTPVTSTYGTCTCGGQVQ